MAFTFEDAMVEVDEAMIAWARQMREVCSGNGNRIQEILKWRNPKHGTFVLSSASEPVLTDVAVSSAFHLETYHRLHSAIVIARRLADSRTGTWKDFLVPADFVLRMFYNAISAEPRSNEFVLNEDMIHKGIHWLSSALQNVVPLKVSTLLRGLFCRESLYLSDSVHLEALPDKKLFGYVGLGFVSPRLEGNIPYGTTFNAVINFADNARTALIRTVTDEGQNMSHEVAASDFKRLLDVIALVDGKNCISVGWMEQKADNPFSEAGISYQLHDSFQPPTYMAVEGFDIDRFRSDVSLRWRQIESLEASYSTALLRSAVRRIGFAASRVVSEDRLIDSVFALETALSDGINDNPNSKHLIQRANFLWTEKYDAENARDMRKIFDAIYAIRSDIAHGKLVEESRIEFGASEAFKLAREIVTLRLGDKDASIANFDAAANAWVRA